MKVVGSLFGLTSTDPNRLEDSSDLQAGHRRETRQSRQAGGQISHQRPDTASVLSWRFGPHRDELFGRCRMDADGGVELCFGCAAVERYGQSLNDLSRIGSNHVAAKDSITRAVDD